MVNVALLDVVEPFLALLVPCLGKSTCNLSSGATIQLNNDKIVPLILIIL
jgi:hypothetical protein